MLSQPVQLQYLKLLLRIGGVVTGSAFFAMLLPVEWMASTHERLGMGTFPRAPVVDYLARSVAAFYGFHGVLLFVVAQDPVRLRPIVTYLAAFNIIFGVMLIAIDVYAGMPAWWTTSEGPVVIVIGIMLTILRRWL
jgi:hypothetical protein